MRGQPTCEWKSLWLQKEDWKCTEHVGGTLFIHTGVLNITQMPLQPIGRRGASAHWLFQFEVYP